MRLSKVVGLLVSIWVIVVTAFTASGVMAQDTANAEFRQFLGTITGNEDIFVGVAIVGEDVTIYICDGQADKGMVSIAEWFIGKVANNAIDITEGSGNRVEVTIDGDTATGKFTFTDGTVLEFVAAIPEGFTGLFRSDFSLGSLEYIGGWLVLPDGSTRGAIFVKSTGDLFPATLDRFELVGGPPARK
jgi:hypothetical protein